MDIEEIRRNNLARLIEERGGPTAVAKTLGYKSGVSYLSQLLRKHTRFGETAARKIEKALMLEPYFLDRDNGGRRADQERAIISSALRGLGEALARLGLEPPPNDFARLAALTVEDSLEHGQVSDGYLRALLDAYRSGQLKLAK